MRRYFKDDGLYHRVNYLRVVDSGTWQTEGTPLVVIHIDAEFLHTRDKSDGTRLAYPKHSDNTVSFGLRSSLIEGWIVESDEDLHGKPIEENKEDDIC